MSSDPLMAELLATIAADDDARAEACAVQLTAAAEPALLEMLDSSNNDYRWWGVRALAVCGTAQSLSAIALRLDDVDASVRTAALLTVAHLHHRHPDAATPLLDQVAEHLQDDDGMARQAAADALAQCGDDAVPALAYVLFQQAHEGARTRAAAALRKLATMKAAGVLYALLNDQNHLVRAYAYEGLDEMGLLETVLVTL